jgi:hypothetical protein
MLPVLLRCCPLRPRKRSPRPKAAGRHCNSVSVRQSVGCHCGAAFSTFVRNNGPWFAAVDSVSIALVALTRVQPEISAKYYHGTTTTTPAASYCLLRVYACMADRTTSTPLMTSSGNSNSMPRVRFSIAFKRRNMGMYWNRYEPTTASTKQVWIQARRYTGYVSVELQ